MQLLLRTTRSLSVTDAGRGFYDNAKRAVENVNQADLAARDDAGLTGTLRVSASVCFTRIHVMTRLPELLAQHPDIERRAPNATRDSPSSPGRGKGFSSRIARILRTLSEAAAAGEGAAAAGEAAGAAAGGAAAAAPPPAAASARPSPTSRTTTDRTR